MTMQRVFLFVLLLLILAPSNGASAGRLLNSWPVCAEASAVNPATAAYIRHDVGEIRRLGCLRSTPDALQVRTLRCAPSVLDRDPPWFPYPIERDTTLPESVCQIGVSLPDGWKTILYTDFMNISTVW